MMHLLYSYLLALYLLIVPGFPPPATPERAAADTLRRDALAAASEAPAARLTFSTTNLVFATTGTGYYRDSMLTIGASAPTAVTIRAKGDIEDFQFPSNFPRQIDTADASISIRFAPTLAGDSCSTLWLIIDSGTAIDTVWITGCATGAVPPFNTGTPIDFGTTGVRNSVVQSDLLRWASNGPVTYRYALRDTGAFAITLPAADSVMVSNTAGIPIVLTFHPTMPGTFTDVLTLRTTIGDYMVQMSGRAISLAIDSVEYATPDSVYIAYVGEPIIILDSIDNHSSESFQAAHSDTLDPSGTFTLSSERDFLLGPNSRHGITVEFKPPAIGNYTAYDTLALTTSNQQFRGIITRAYRGRGVQGILETSTDTLRFTALQPGRCESGKAVEEQSVRLTNAGNIGMKILYSLEKPGPEFSIVAPSPADTIRLDSAGSGTITVRLCGWDSADYTNTLLLYDVRNPNTLKRVVLVHDRVGGGGQADTALLRADVDTLSFGAVALDSTAIDSIIIRNFGTAAGVIDTNVITGGNSGDFRIITPTARNIAVPPGSSITVVIAFTPGSLGTRASGWRGTWDRGDSILLRVVLTGLGVAPRNPDTARTASFPTLHERVGNTIRMPLRIDTRIPVEWESARIVINPMALRLESVEPAGLTYGRTNNDSLIIVYRPGGTPLTGDGTLFTLVFTGLSTGKPVNIVTIDTIRGPIPIASGTNGVVELDGCDVGQYAGSSLKPSIGALRVEPGGAAAALTYRAADGAIPTVTLFDLGGTEMIRRTLPMANGGAQTLWLSLRDIPRGIYWLELRVESDRLVAPIIINR